MAVKVALALIVLAIIVVAFVMVAFWYFKETAELEHERELKQMEQDEKLFGDGDVDPIDEQLERERE